MAVGKQTDLAPDEAPAVKIAVMNNDIKHINETLVRLEGKWDVAIQSFATTQQLLDAISASDTRHKDYDKQLDNHNIRIEKLETKSDRQDGAISLLNKLLIALTGVAAIVGALWWVKG